MKLSDNSCSRRKDEGALAFTIRRGWEIGREGFIGLLWMAGLVGVAAATFTILGLINNLITLLLGSN